MTYGYQVQDGEDPFVNLIEKANNNFNAATVPGAFPVDFFPFLKCLPEWLPGSGFLRTARLWAKDTAAMVDVPYNYTKQEMVWNDRSPSCSNTYFFILQEAGNAFPSFVSTTLENEHSLSAEDIRDVKFTASSIYGGRLY